MKDIIEVYRIETDMEGLSAPNVHSIPGPRSSEFSPDQADITPPVTGQAEFSPDDVKLYKKTKKRLKQILIESGSAGVLTVLFLFAGCKSPLPMILAALEATQASGEECKAIAVEAAVATVGLEFFAGAGAYALVRAISNKLSEDGDEDEDEDESSLS